MSKARNLADLISGNSKIEAIEIADGVLTAAKMAANSIDSAQYVDGSIDTAHIAIDQITNALMADDAIDSVPSLSIDNINIDNNSITAVASNIEQVSYTDVGSKFITVFRTI